MSVESTIDMIKKLTSLDEQLRTSEEIIAAQKALPIILASTEVTTEVKESYKKHVSEFSRSLATRYRTEGQNTSNYVNKLKHYISALEQYKFATTHDVSENKQLHIL